MHNCEWCTFFCSVTYHPPPPILAFFLFFVLDSCCSIFIFLCNYLYIIVWPFNLCIFCHCKYQYIIVWPFNLCIFCPSSVYGFYGIILFNLMIKYSCKQPVSCIILMCMNNKVTNAHLIIYNTLIRIVENDKTWWKIMYSFSDFYELYLLLVP